MISHHEDAIFWLEIAILWWFFFWPYRQYHIDRVRHELFVIRNHFFDSAAHGEHILFEDPAYMMTRTTINGMLRSIEDFTLLNLLVLVWRYSRSRARRDSCARHTIRFKRSIAQLSPEGRKLVWDTTRDATRVFVTYALYTSIIGLVLIALFRLSAIVQYLRGWHSRFLALYRHVRLALNYESNIAGNDSLPIYAETTV